jgi:polynucleotide 5'-hydroxyl-kinase GRC3/NOL9
VVDTTGLISGELGKALKTAKIRAIRPAHIVAIQRGDELEHILSLVGDARIHRLKASRAAKTRSASSRRAYRKRKLEEYFRERGQSEHILDASAMPFFYRGRPFRHGDREMPQGAIIGLNRNNDTIALGIIESVAGTIVFFRSPLRSLKGINRVVCGDMTMS